MAFALGLATVSLEINSLTSAATYSFDGKCGFLMDSLYQEKCTALFNDDVLTLIPKGSRQVRIQPQQIVFIALASKNSLKMNENLALYEKAIPWWQPWSKLPNWVKDATSDRVESHQFSIGYVDKNFNPKIMLYVTEDRNKAAAFASELQATSGLSMGESRTADRALDNRLTQKLLKDAQRQAQRLASMCSEWMFEDAEPVASALDTYIKNTSEEISIFDNSEKTIKKLSDIANAAFKQCDGQLKAEIAQAQAEERARLEAIRRTEAAARAARAAAAAAKVARTNQAAAAERIARRSAWDSLAAS